jgi:hypothetical protein
MRYRAKVTLVALAVAASIPVAMARSQFDVQLNIGPPAPVYEVQPAPRAGYVWAPGYWDYQGNHHMWRKGHWEHDRHGQHWSGGRWTQHDGKWYLNRGHWEHG